jgi:hypothetical protein
VTIRKITATQTYAEGEGPENEEEAIQGLLESLADDCATVTFSSEPWDDDSIQFPRLICELMTTIKSPMEDWDALCASMDITPAQLNILVERARAAWEKAKEEA